MDKQERKKKNTETRQLFLLTFFTHIPDRYEELFLNGFWLIKQWNGGTNHWEVAIYTPESYNNRKEYLLIKKKGLENPMLF